MSNKNDELRKYIVDTSMELIDHYKDLVKKTFEVADKDLLQDKIDADGDKDDENKLLDAIKKRRVALDEADHILEKIEKLEQRINPDLFTKPGENKPAKRNFAKDNAKKD
jgi:hypothetical protein